LVVTRYYTQTRLTDEYCWNESTLVA
jgi:hypothetical protein